MPVASQAMQHAVERNGVMIARTPKGVAVSIEQLLPQDEPVRVQVEYRGKRLKDLVLGFAEPFYRDYFGPTVDHLQCVIRVGVGSTVLALLDVPDDQKCLPFMVLQGEQRHVTENYVSVPPALTITDEVGAVWTLGFLAAPKDQSPEGEFAFDVLRDGVKTGEIASRIERRSSRIRILTRHGWKRWNGRTFF